MSGGAAQEPQGQRPRPPAGPAQHCGRCRSAAGVPGSVTPEQRRQVPHHPSGTARNPSLLPGCSSAPATKFKVLGGCTGNSFLSKSLLQPVGCWEREFIWDQPPIIHVPSPSMFCPNQTCSTQARGLWGGTGTVSARLLCSQCLGCPEELSPQRPPGSHQSGTPGLHQMATKPTDNVLWLLEERLCHFLRMRRAEQTSVVYNKTF